MMVAHFDTDQILDEEAFTFRLNRIVPADVAIEKVERVADDKHARFDAKQRTYHYYVYSKKNPYRRHYANRLAYVPDYDLMNEAAKVLLDVDDFTSFSKVNNDQKNNICTVTHAQWAQIDEDYWRFEITANRFLRNMVRAIVGTLLEVGRGRMSVKEFREVIMAQNRCSAGESVAGNALFLVDIQY